MRGIGTLANVVTVILGTSVGLLSRRSLPRRTTAGIMHVLGLFTVGLGVAQFLGSEKPLVPMLGLLTGAAIGSAFRLQNRLDTWVDRAFPDEVSPASEGARIGDDPPRPNTQVGSGRDGGGSSLDKGAERGTFVRAGVLASIVFCAGPMTFLGAVRDGALGDPQLLLTKAAMDGVSSAAFASVLGPGVYLAAVVVLVLQGALTLFSASAGAWVSEEMVREVGSAGGLLVFAVGLDLLEVKRLPVLDYLPALVTTPVIYALGSWLR